MRHQQPRISRRAAATAVLSVLSLLSLLTVASCGESSGSPSTSPAAATTSAPAATAAPATATSTTISPTTSSPTTIPPTTIPPTTIPPTTMLSTTAVATTAVATTVAPAMERVLIYGVRDERLVALPRLVEHLTPSDAVEALLLGPTDAERDGGISSMMPAGTTLHGVAIDGADVTVDLSSAFDSGGGSLAVTARVAQLVFTVTQFAGLERVHVAIDGTTVTSITGDGVSVDGIGRADMEPVLPIILVESPLPGDAVTQPIHVSGSSNTFEAVVNYQVLAADGSLLVESSLMASSGTGTRGVFDADLASLPPGTTGSVIVRLFEYSSEDGTPVNIVDIPVELS